MTVELELRSEPGGWTEMVRGWLGRPAIEMPVDAEVVVRRAGDREDTRYALNEIVELKLNPHNRALSS